jgi:F0F1-type ATP synthase assembly protein I
VSENRRKKAAEVRRIADASSVGLAFPIAIGIGYLWGHFLDRAIGTAPWLTYIFSILGVIAGFLNAFRVAGQVGDEEDRDARGGQ